MQDSPRDLETTQSSAVTRRQLELKNFHMDVTCETRRVTVCTRGDDRVVSATDTIFSHALLRLGSKLPYPSSSVTSIPPLSIFLGAANPGYSYCIHAIPSIEPCILLEAYTRAELPPGLCILTHFIASATCQCSYSFHFILQLDG